MKALEESKKIRYALYVMLEDVILIMYLFKLFFFKKIDIIIDLLYNVAFPWTFLCRY